MRVRYLHGRPGPHPLHRSLAQAVGGEFEFVDFRMRWQDKARPRPYVVASWILCAATLPGRRAHQVFLIDNLHIWPVLMKRVLLRRDQKIVAHLGSHTLYFLFSHRFAHSVEKLHLWALRNYDALLCEGAMSVELTRELLGRSGPRVYETFIGLSKAHMERLRALDPDLEGRRIVFIGSGPGEFRAHYKGLDLMTEAVALARQQAPEIEFVVVGDWSEDDIERVLGSCSGEVREGIHFRGVVDDIAPVLGRASLCLHCARGDAFPTATIEAMAAGVVTLVSEWTGTRQLVNEVSEQLIAPLDAEAIAERIAWYFARSSAERQDLSKRCRAVAGNYTEDAAVAHYQATFRSMCRDLGLAGATGAPDKTAVEVDQTDVGRRE